MISQVTSLMLTFQVDMPKLYAHHVLMCRGHENPHSRPLPACRQSNFSGRRNLSIHLPSWCLLVAYQRHGMMFSCIPTDTDFSLELKAVLLCTTERMSSKDLCQPCSCCRSVSSRDRNNFSNIISPHAYYKMVSSVCTSDLPATYLPMPLLWAQDLIR